MPTSVNRQVIFVEVEAAYNTAEVLVAADALVVRDLNFDPNRNRRLLERQNNRNSLNRSKALHGGSLRGVSFTVDIKGSGSAGVAPQALGDLLRACGLDETVVASTSVTYTPNSDIAQHEGCTIGVGQGANYRILRGCRGTFSINLVAGEIGSISFDMTGHVESEAEAAHPTPSYQAGTPPIFQDVALTIASVEYPCSALTFDIANEIAPAPDANQPKGYGQVYITGRASGGTIDPEDQDIDTKDFIAVMEANTSQAIATGVVGGTAGNRYALSIPQAYYRSCTFADRNNLIIQNIEFGAEDTDGADDFSLQFT